MSVLLFVLKFLVVISSCCRPIAFSSSSDGNVINAIAVLNNPPVQGVIHFKQQQQHVSSNAGSSSASVVYVWGEITGLTPGLHGFHVHEYGDLSNGCKSAGGHYNPQGKSHGDIADDNRHVGDQGNIRADDSGVARLNYQDYRISLNGNNSVIGRALIVHAKPDDLGKGGNRESAMNGNSGARLACGVIGMVNPAHAESGARSSAVGPNIFNFYSHKYTYAHHTFIVGAISLITTFNVLVMHL